MRKLFLLAFSTILVSGIFASTTVVLANATNETSPTVNVQINSDRDVYGVQFDVIYDPSALSIEASEISSLLNNVDQVYAKVKEDGLLRVVMFDLNGNKLHSAKSSATSIISLPFTAMSTLGLSTAVKAEKVIVAGFNGEDLKAKSEDITIDSFVPQVTSLSKNYPNPFNPSTTIEYSIAKSGFVSLVIYDINGAEVKTLVNEIMDASNYMIEWSGRNNNGQSVASGQYFYVMTAPGFSSTEYMTLLK